MWWTVLPHCCNRALRRTTFRLQSACVTPSSGSSRSPFLVLWYVYFVVSMRSASSKSQGIRFWFWGSFHRVWKIPFLVCVIGILYWACAQPRYGVSSDPFRALLYGHIIVGIAPVLNLKWSVLGFDRFPMWSFDPSASAQCVMCVCEHGTLCV